MVDLLCCIFLGLLAGSFTEQKGVAKKVISDSAGMVSFGIGLVHSVLNLPDGLVKFFGMRQITEELQSVLLVKNFFRLFKMAVGLVSNHIC